MADLSTLDAMNRRAAMLRRAMLRLVRSRGNFRGRVLARISLALGKSRRRVPTVLANEPAAPFNFLSVPFNTLADLGIGQAGGGGGSSGIK